VAKFQVTCYQITPDLRAIIQDSPSNARPGHELTTPFKVKVANNMQMELKDIAVDIVLKKDNFCPVSTNSTDNVTHYSDGILLKGGRERVSLKAGQTLDIKLTGLHTIPANTPLGDYYLCAVVNAGDQIKQRNKTNDCSCHPIEIIASVDKPDLVIQLISCKEGKKCEPGYPIYIFEVTIKNIGTAPSPSLPNATLLQIIDIGSKWGNGATLNSIPPGETQTVFIPVYYFSEDPAHMTKEVPHPFRAVIDPSHLIEEASKRNKTADIIYLDPRLICHE